MRFIAAQVNTQRAGYPSKQQSIPAPYGGLNTRDSLADMPPHDAVVLDNLFPDSGSVNSRGAYTKFGTGLDGDVETLMDLHTSSTRKFVAASGTKLFTIPDAGGAATQIGSGYTNARWQYVVFANRLCMVNGADGQIDYDGTTVSTSSLSGTGLTASNLNGINIYKGRAFYWENAAPHFWYNTSAGAYQGTLAKFDLSQIASRGGNVAAMGTWTRDGGSGPDDYAAFFMTSGEVLVYVGTDPGSASDWSLVGRYDLPPLLSVRSLLRYGGDLFMMTTTDFDTLTNFLRRAQDPENVLPSKLTGAATEYARAYSSYYGWQAVYYPRGYQVLFNTPASTGDTAWYQYGINSNTGAAFRYTNMNSACFGVYNQRLYFGGNDVVYRADDGLYDNDSEAIEIDAQQAFSALGDGARKHFTAVVPVVETDGNVDLSLGLSYDYQTASVTQAVSTVSTGTSWGSPWGSSWSPEDRMRYDQFGATGDGRAVSLRIRASLENQSLNWYRTDYMYRPLSKF